MASARSLFVIYKKIKHTRALNTGPENTDRGKSVQKLVIKALKDQEPRNYLMFFFSSGSEEERRREEGCPILCVGPVQARLSSR